MHIENARSFCNVEAAYKAVVLSYSITYHVSLESWGESVRKSSRREMCLQFMLARLSRLETNNEQAVACHWTQANLCTEISTNWKDSVRWRTTTLWYESAGASKLCPSGQNEKFYLIRNTRSSKCETQIDKSTAVRDCICIVSAGDTHEFRKQKPESFSQQKHNKFQSDLCLCPGSFIMWGFIIAFRFFAR